MVNGFTSDCLVGMRFLRVIDPAVPDRSRHRARDDIYRYVRRPADHPEPPHECVMHPGHTQSMSADNGNYRRAVVKQSVDTAQSGLPPRRRADMASISYCLLGRARVGGATADPSNQPVEVSSQDSTVGDQDVYRIWFQRATRSGFAHPALCPVARYRGTNPLARNKTYHRWPDRTLCNNNRNRSAAASPTCLVCASELTVSSERSIAAAAAPGLRVRPRPDVDPWCGDA